MTPSQVRTGPIFDIAYSVLSTRPEYLEYAVSGDRMAFSRFLDEIAPDLVAAGLPPEDVHFAKRYPPREEAFVDETLARLVAEGILPHATYDNALYEQLAAEVRREHHHGLYRTYIYPEEARLLYAIAEIARPRQAAFLGSYYGYWAHAALTAIVRNGGRAVLVDPNPKTQEVARTNVQRAGLLGPVEVAVTTGEEYMDSAASAYDFVVLDAENPRDHPDPEQRGKCVYGSLVRRALPRMTQDAMLVCHNILFEDIAACPFFDRVIERNRSELGPFLQIVAEQFAAFVECTSTEGVGVGRRARISAK